MIARGMSVKAWKGILREEKQLRILENRVLRKIMWS
jgi:hypothetical protein